MCLMLLVPVHFLLLQFLFSEVVVAGDDIKGEQAGCDEVFSFFSFIWFNFVGHKGLLFNDISQMEYSSL